MSLAKFSVIIIFWFLKKVDKDIYNNICEFLDNAKYGYEESIKRKEKNNRYNAIKLDNRYEKLQIARIKETERIIFYGK